MDSTGNRTPPPEQQTCERQIADAILISRDADGHADVHADNHADGHGHGYADVITIKLTMIVIMFVVVVVMMMMMMMMMACGFTFF